MSPIGPYGNFDECVLKNADKSSPEGFCAWLEHKITGAWPGQLSGDKFPESFWTAYDAALVAQKSEPEAYKEAVAAAEAEGFELTRFGWVKQFQAPVMKKITGVKVFAEGEWTDSSGMTREWKTEDLDKMVEAFTAGVPAIVPLKCGHTSDEFNQRIAEALGVPVEVVTGEQGQGQIALGKMTSLERKGGLAIAAFDNIPDPIANLIEGGQYSTVSVEIEDAVGDYGPVITGVALLGAEEPAVDKATLERALVFGGSRQGARVLSFTVGEDIPVETLRTEFTEIRGKLAEIIKGKRGAPLFRALFGNLSELFERMVGSINQKKGDVMNSDFHTVDERMRGVRWAAQELGLSEDATIDQVIAALQQLKEGDISEEVRAHIEQLTSKEGGNQQMPEELKPIAAALGLGEEATAEDIVAAIKGLIDAAKAAAAAPNPNTDQMAAELKKAGELIASLQATNRVGEWGELTQAFTAIPGTAKEHAIKLAAIESKAGKETADVQFTALAEANRLAIDAQTSLGTNRTPVATDFDNEVAKYMKENPKAERVEAIKAVQKSHPGLYFARRDQWEQ